MAGPAARPGLDAVPGRGRARRRPGRRPRRRSSQGLGGGSSPTANCQVNPPAAPLASRTSTFAVWVPAVSFWLVWIDHSRGERLSICAPASAPLTVNVAVARSAPRPTSTADRVTGASAGTWPFTLGAMVRTIGGAATADGEATADGLGLVAAMPGEGTGSGRRRNASLAVSVRGKPGGGGG